MQAILGPYFFFFFFAFSYHYIYKYIALNCCLNYSGLLSTCTCVNYAKRTTTRDLPALLWGLFGFISHMLPILTSL